MPRIPSYLPAALVGLGVVGFLVAIFVPNPNGDSIWVHPQGPENWVVNVILGGTSQDDGMSQLSWISVALIVAGAGLWVYQKYG